MTGRGAIGFFRRAIRHKLDDGIGEFKASRHELSGVRVDPLADVDDIGVVVARRQLVDIMPHGTSPLAKRLQHLSFQVENKAAALPEQE